MSIPLPKWEEVKKSNQVRFKLFDFSNLVRFVLNGQVLYTRGTRFEMEQTVS